jgi:septum formation protein
MVGTPRRQSGWGDWRANPGNAAARLGYHPETVAIDHQHPLLLGSASPRRRELLTTIGVPLSVASVAVDEAIGPGETPDAYLERVVESKRQAAVGLWDQARASSPDVDQQLARCAGLLVADTVVVHQGHILGKPRDDGHARAMLTALAGQPHQVMTRFAIDEPGSGRPVSAETVSTQVWFVELDPAQLERYVATGEGRDKAGAYAIQGIGSLLVERIDGSYSNVVGLPVSAVVRTLKGRGLIGPLPLTDEG